MENSFTIFDIVIISITVLLGLKGLLKGFIKEVFGLIGIIGGIFVASRLAEYIGNMIAPILTLENQATIKLIGFIVSLIGFWAIVYVAGIILAKISSASGLGVFDRILGFLFGSAKIFFIFSVIVYALYQVQSFKSLMDEKVAKSTTFPFLLSTGGFIIKLDASDFVKKVEEKIDSPELTKTLEEIKETTIEATQKTSEAVKETVSDVVNETIKEKVEETKDNLEQNRKEN